MQRRFTVFGGTGYLGQRIVGHLTGLAGTSVRVAVRHPERVEAREGITSVQADVTDPESVARAVEGSDAVVNAVSLYVPGRHVGFHDVHVDGAGRVATQAARAGATLVHVSGVGADPQSGQRYVRARGLGEAAVREAHGSATIIRPTVLFSARGGLVRQILDVLEKAPIFPLFGRGETRLQPVHADDVARAACRLTRSEDAATYEFGGPETLAYHAIVRQIAAAAGEPARLLPMPFAFWQAGARVAEHLPGHPLTRDQVALMREDKIAAPDLPGLTEAGIDHTSLGDALAERFPGRPTDSG